jgi:hypothetical protein
VSRPRTVSLSTAQLLSNLVLALNTNMNWTVKEKVNFVNSSQNKGLFPSCMALSFDGFGSISWHSVWFKSDGSFSFHIFFRISNFFHLKITEETWVVGMHIWCIKIGNLLVLHWVVQTLLLLAFIFAWHDTADTVKSSRKQQHVQIHIKWQKGKHMTCF